MLSHHQQDLQPSLADINGGFALWTETEIQVYAPSLGSDGFFITVLNQWQQQTADTTYSIGPVSPSISSVSPTTLATAGNELISNNGEFFSTNAAVTIGNDECVIVSNAESLITCTSPPGQGTDFVVVTSSSGQQGITSILHTSPVIDSISPSIASTEGGIEFVLTGSNFGVSSQVIVIGSFTCDNPVFNAAHTILSCDLPAGVGTSLEVGLTVDSLSVTYSLFSYLAPVVSGISGSSSTAGGSTLMIYGSNFGPETEDVTVLISSKSCTVLSHNHTHIFIEAPVGSGSDLLIQVFAGTQESNTDKTFSYDAPVISSINHFERNSDGTSVLTILGTSFYTSGTVTIDGSLCDEIAYTHTNITCIIPEGKGSFGYRFLGL